MFLNGIDEPFAREERTKSSFKVNEMRTTIHSYMLVSFNRLVDQAHMWIKQDFVVEFKEDFYRKLDQEFAPTAATNMGLQIRSAMVEKQADITRRANAAKAIEDLKASIAEIDAINTL